METQDPKLEIGLLLRGSPPPSPERNETYIITLSPGKVRYLSVYDLFRTDHVLDEVIPRILKLSDTPKIQCALNYYDSSTGWWTSLETIDRLFPIDEWAEKLRFHQKIIQLFKEYMLPSFVYSQFHEHLKLEELNVSECAESWMSEANGKVDLIDSYRESKNHLVIGYSAFLRTTFVCQRLKAIAAAEEKAAREKDAAAKQQAKQLKEAEEQKCEAEDLSRLKKSAYHTYVYLMEDLRNGCFKIGRSKTPSKRERTLQSEVPSVTLRFSIPSDEEHEGLLHEQFNKNNVRGEWFSLTANDLLWIISFLKKNGDMDRAYVDHEWLGKISMQSSQI